jgi:hypothetical protein
MKRKRLMEERFRLVYILVIERKTFKLKTIFGKVRVTTVNLAKGFG